MGSDVYKRQLKSRVDQFFAENELHPAGSQRLFWKGALQMGTAIALYVWVVFFTPGPVVAALICALLGICFGAIGFNIMHEGCHQSFSRHGWLNKLTGYSLNFLGGSAYFWKQKHNISHHTYTNIEGMDHDIDLAPFMRLHENQKHYWFHRFQHYYWVFLYSLAYLSWILLDDFKRYFSGRMGSGAEKKALAPSEHVIFWATKLSFFALYLVIPILMVGWAQALIGFAIVAAVCGIFISIVFQLAHVVEPTQFPAPDAQSNKVPTEWAIHQLATTANFATRSRITSWLLGGLNFQVEHHLFPRISHVHYPQINRLVKESCQEFGIQYTEFPTMLGALKSHVLHIRKMGRLA